jgi:uncharacterized membrane protein HdeD (DUF308 family)
MGSLKDALVVIVGLAALIFGIYKFYLFVTTANATHNMWWAIGCGVVFFVCGLIYFLGHVNKEEEIHITQ